MKSSCISHDKREPLIIIRKSYVELCSNNHCAAALISYFEYWHNIKLDMQSRAEKANAVAVNHGDEPTQDTSLLQFHTADDLVNGMVGLFKIAKIRDAIELLKSLKIISVHKNPNPRYKFDNTRYFLFNPDIVKKTYRHDENSTRSVENSTRSVENSTRSVENDTTITETTTETTTETSSDIKKNSASESLEEKAQVEKLKKGQFAKPDTFQITFDWKPSENFETRCKMAGKDFTKFNDDILLSFINYNESREQYKTQKEWEGLLLTAFTRELAKPAAKAQSTYKPFEKIVTPENASSASDFVATKKNTISEEEKARRKEFLAAQRQQNGEPA